MWSGFFFPVPCFVESNEFSVATCSRLPTFSSVRVSLGDRRKCCAVAFDCYLAIHVEIVKLRALVYWSAAFHWLPAGAFHPPKDESSVKSWPPFHCHCASLIKFFGSARRRYLRQTTMEDSNQTFWDGMLNEPLNFSTATSYDDASSDVLNSSFVTFRDESRFWIQRVSLFFLLSFSEGLFTHK